MAVVLVGSFLSRWPFRHAPLIRDEGEYALIGQRILEGAVPYVDLYNQKTPFAFYWMAAVQAVLGESVAALRVATGLYGVTILVVVYALTRRLAGHGAGIAATVAMALLILDSSVIVHSASTEFFMLLWLALGALAWLRSGPARGPWAAVLSGACAGMAYQTKQTGIALLVFFWAEALWSFLVQRGRRRLLSKPARDGVLATVGFGAVVVAVFLWFAANGALGAYVECTWTNNWQYVGNRDRGPGLLLGVVREVAHANVGLWLLGIAGLALLARRRGDRSGSGMWLLLAVTAGAAISAGTLYRHYWVPLFVGLSIGIGAASGRLLQEMLSRDLPGWRRLVGLAILVAAWSGTVRVTVPSLVSPAAVLALETAWVPPAADSRAVAAYVAEQTAPGQDIVVVGSEPQVYYYAARPPSTRMIVTYPMTGPYSYAPSLRSDFLERLEQDGPAVVVLVRLPWSLSEWPAIGQALMRDVEAILSRRYTVGRTFDVALPEGSFGDGFVVYRRRDREE